LSFSLFNVNFVWKEYMFTLNSLVLADNNLTVVNWQYMLKIVHYEVTSSYSQIL
jgi:hypothetical protein